MSIGWLLERFEQHRDRDAMIWRGETFGYHMLLDRIRRGLDRIAGESIGCGDVVMLDADFSPMSVGMLLALIHARAIVVPVAAHVTADRFLLAKIATAGYRIHVDPQETVQIQRCDHQVSHELLLGLRRTGNPGLVLFSSGTTGEPKATLHDLSVLLEKFQVPRHTQRIITFLLFDHIGGFNTLMYGLANHGCIITVSGRDPDTVCRTIQETSAEVLPTSPTFLRLMLMTQAHRRYDLSSLRVINYATEVMPQTTLTMLREAFPSVELRQSYGLSEVGILRSQSRSSDSLWVKVGGEGYATRVVDGTLQVKARSSMLGYLNAPSPFTADGWFDTKDEVEVDGDWVRFKGRRSSIINVGGEKVYPEEVEAVLLEVDNVAEAVVKGQPHPFTGSIVVAEIRLRAPEDLAAVTTRIRTHCFSRLPAFKVPVSVSLMGSDAVLERFKKRRS